MRSALVCSILSLALLTSSGSSRAQEKPQFPGAEKEHAWLQRFVGKWSVDSEALTGPDQPPMKCKATMRSRMLGQLWVISEMEGDMAGTKVHSLQTIGYDPAKKKYVGTWVDSLLNYMWHTEGTVDQTGRILTLEAQGPNFAAEGKIAKFRDSYEFKSPDHFVVTSSMQGDDGKWTTFMSGHARRGD